MRTAFGSVLYEQAWKWKDDFIDSINEQTSKDFDILLMNDGVPAIDVESLRKQSNKNITSIDVVDNRTISEIRIDLIQEAKSRGYNLLILGDFDDSFSQRRVEQIQKAYHIDISFYYNDILCNGKPIFTDVPDTVTSISQIEESNFLGLSNTAINLSAISMDFLNGLSDVKTNVFDWYFYAMLLLEPKTIGLHISDAYTYYRQHENNIAGVMQKSYKKEIEIKIAHYCLLSKHYEKANYLLEKYKELASSKTMAQHYISKESTGYWWSLIRTED